MSPHITQLKNYYIKSCCFFSLLLFLIATNTSMMPDYFENCFKSNYNNLNLVMLHGSGAEKAEVFSSHTPLISTKTIMGVDA